jgi:hypothetical protein
VGGASPRERVDDTVGNRDVTFRDDPRGSREPAATGQRHHRTDTFTDSPEVAESGSSCDPPWTWTSVRTAAPVLRGSSGGGRDEAKATTHTPLLAFASLVYRTTRPLRDDRRCRRRRFFTTVAGRDHHILHVVCSKIALPSYTSSGVHSRRPRRVLLRYRRATAGPRSVLVGFHHLDGFLLQKGACVLQHAADPRVRPVWPLARFPPDAALPFEAFPPPAAARRHSRACARDSPTGPTLSAFPLPHLPAPVLLAKEPRRSSVGGEDPQGLAPRTGPLSSVAFPPHPTRCSHGLA